MPNDLADRLEELAGKATAGDLRTAQFEDDGWIECPVCCGQGEVDGKDYCNIDGKALGVQFYGIGHEFGTHEELWTLLINALPEIIAALRKDQP